MQSDNQISCVGSATIVNDVVRVVTPISISAVNCVAVTGMSWSWVLRFARKQGVQVWRVGTRKHLVNASQLAAAMARMQELEPVRQPTEEELRAEFDAAIATALARGKHR